MPRISTNQVAMGVGASGALTDVSTYADLAAGITREWGRRTEFESIAPGTFSFVLDNASGQFTPGNTTGNAAAGFSTTVTEGMSVCWNLGGRLVAGTILSIEPMFPGDDSAWAQVRITCDDMLGNAGRVQVDGELSDALLRAADTFLFWPLTDAAGSVIAEEATLNALYGPMAIKSGSATFGSAAISTQIPGTTASLASSTSLSFANYSLPAGIFDYGTATAGYFSFWAVPTASNKFYLLAANSGGGLSNLYMDWNTNVANKFSVFSDAATAWTPPSTGFFDSWHFFSFGMNVVGGNLIFTLYVDGVLQITKSQGAVSPVSLFQTVEFYSQVGPVSVARISHTRRQPHEEYAFVATTPGALITAFCALAPELTLDSLPSDLTAVASSSTGAGSVLDNLNAVIASEQGAIYAQTTGTLTSPAQEVTVRTRTRSATVTASWDVARELSGAPEFVRDITNFVSGVTVSGPTLDVYVNSAASSNAQLTARAGSANASESVIMIDLPRLVEWGQDRLNRGSNVTLRVASVTIDAMTTPTDRTSDLLALVPGDRHQFTNLPSTQLGFSTWDGWLLGVTENHTLTEHTFTLYFQPVLPDTAIFDTNYFMADGALTLSAGINSAVTSMSVATSATTTKLETATFPYTLLIDSEQMTVTACTAATPQVVTVTRGVNGTTAAAHSSGAAVEVYPSSLYAF